MLELSRNGALGTKGKSKVGEVLQLIFSFANGQVL